MKQLIFSILLFLLPITILAQDQQQRVWLLLNKNQVVSNNESSKESVDESILKIIQGTHIDSVNRVFPYSQNDTLQRLFEIKATINQLNHILSSPEIETIYFPSDGEETILYQPTDHMWYCNYPDSTNWLWHLKKIMADYAWDITKGDTSIKIAILDTWFDINHPELRNQMFCTYDPFDNQPFYTNGAFGNHGTAVASFAAAETDNGISLASIGFKCKIIPYKAQNNHFLERAHHASLAMKADVLTSSAGGWNCDRNFNDIERIAVKEILDNGTVIVMPAGNGEYGSFSQGSRCYNPETGTDQPWRPLHPYYDDRIIIVSGTNKNDCHQNAPDSSLSHFPEVDICAPGYSVMGARSTVDVYGNSQWPFFGSYVGTSFATPIVAGVCALIKSVNRCLTPEDIQDIIKQTADPIQDANLYPGMLGAGRINAYQAVSLAQTYHKENDTITSNATWSTNSYKGGDVVIDSLATLTITGTLHCSSSARIIVRPGPKSPTPSFLALKQQYEAMADTARNDYSQQLNAVVTEMYAQSHERVRALMADTLEDLQAVMAWLDATPGLASRYLEAETEFKLGGNNISLADIANHIATQEERDEYDNYIMFSTLKDALRYGNGHVMWPNATDAQIGELVRIADANTGRSSLLAKNVLCFFFGICYDDMETRALETTTIPPTAESPTLTGQQNITIHPNPTNDILNVTVTAGDAKIARVEMFDMFGRPVSAETHGLASLPSPTLTVNTSGVPSGIYILRVTLTDGSVRNVKFMKNFTK